MYTFAVILHLIVCVLMIASILLQAGKGAEIGASFGGSSQTVFGSRGPGTFLSKVTVGAAIVFMLTSLSLALLSKQANTSSTVIDLHPPSQQQETTSPAATDTSSNGTSPPDGTTPSDATTTEATTTPETASDNSEVTPDSPKETTSPDTP